MTYCIPGTKIRIIAWEIGEDKATEQFRGGQDNNIEDYKLITNHKSLKPASFIPWLPIQCLLLSSCDALCQGFPTIVWATALIAHLQAHFDRTIIYQVLT